MYMDRNIFNLDASVEATSLYILLCALTEESEFLTLERASRRWNGTGEGLLQGATELMARGVLEEAPLVKPNQPLYLTPSNQWR